MSKFAPANESGEKPYTVVGRRWAEELTVVVYAADTATARYNSGFRGTAQYVVSCRRATPEDLETFDIR